MYDTIVIGGGPAGAAAARELARGGARVLLCEKKRLPREKSCSGLLIQKSMRLVEQHFGGPVPDEVQCTPRDNRGMVFFADDGREYRFEQPGLNIWRSRFDAWLCERAADAGAALRDDCYVSALEERDDRILARVGGETITARRAVICEGGAGTLRRKLTGAAPAPVFTWQSFHTGRWTLDPHCFHAFLQRSFSDYDAWANVKDDNLIVGVAARNPEKLKSFHAAFRSHLEAEHGLQIDETRRFERWVMPEVPPGCPLETGGERILFAGEAAGLLNPMGEGVSCGIQSGVAAAQAILAEGEVQRTYRELLAPTHQYMIRQWRFVGGISPSFAAMR